MQSLGALGATLLALAVFAAHLGSSWPVLASDCRPLHKEQVDHNISDRTTMRRSLGEMFAGVAQAVFPDVSESQEQVFEFEFNVLRNALGLSLMNVANSASTESIIEQLQTEVSILKHELASGRVVSMEEELAVAHFLESTASLIVQLRNNGSLSVIGAPKGLHTRRALIDLSQASVDVRLFKRISADQQAALRQRAMPSDCTDLALLSDRSRPPGLPLPAAPPGAGVNLSDSSRSQQSQPFDSAPSGHNSSTQFPFPMSHFVPPAPSHRSTPSEVRSTRSAQAELDRKLKLAKARAEAASSAAFAAQLQVEVAELEQDAATAKSLPG